ncbi:multiple epidermal growth factor-like domains protein 11 [Ptychodera flava]|uniref:multiple epidermal growth factor-like domains protein 11 n=1 Tax=Ptychodera flava TaxID=63121 RepID=UPI00396A8D82
MGYINIICLMCFVHCFDIVSAITGRTLQSDPHACLLEDIEEYKKPMYICCDGYYKENPTVIESPCIECQDGHYGKDCSYHCLCQNGGICNKIDGSCQCLPSHYGTRCDFPCPCDNGGTCNVDFGVLKSCTCKEGYYGDICENKCSCPDGITCDPITGCLCEAGTYGEDCSGICQCPSNSVCNIADGSCTCHPGFYGDKCQHQCNCFNGGRCGKDPNICECPTSWQGPHCTQCNLRWQVDTDIDETFCADKCLNCYNGDECKPHNKTCECTPGWQGERCDLPCETGYHGYNCSQNCECDNVDGCDHVTGHCIVTNDQEQLCPDRCLECHHATDECTKCVEGWLEPRCDVTYLSCNGTINCNGTNEICNCSTSSYPVMDEAYGGNVIATAVVVPALVITVIVVNFVVIMVLIRKRRRHRKECRSYNAYGQLKERNANNYEEQRPKIDSPTNVEEHTLQPLRPVPPPKQEREHTTPSYNVNETSGEGIYVNETMW